MKQKKDEIWESDMCISKDDKCPHVEEHNALVHIPYEVWCKIRMLTTEVDTEWLGYLRAAQVEDGSWLVSDITIPDQDVTGTTVKPTATIFSEGVIHSHVHMGVFFSGVDDDFLNENHDFSIVVNKKGESKAVCRLKLPCGALTLVDAKIQVDMPENQDATAFIEDAKKHITEEVALPVVYQQVNGWGKPVLPVDQTKTKQKAYRGWDVVDGIYYDDECCNVT